MISDLQPAVYRKGGRNVSSILRAAGVEFVQGASFWHRNEGRLHWIHADFVKRAREIKAALHPDREGGNAESYRAFTAEEARVLRQFAEHGINGPSLAQREQSRKFKAESMAARHRADNPPNPRALVSPEESRLRILASKRKWFRAANPGTHPILAPEDKELTPELRRIHGTHAIKCRWAKVRAAAALAACLLLLAPTAFAAPEYRGALDSLDCQQMTGWAAQIGKPDLVLTVNVYIDGVYSTQAKANKPRPDVAAAGFGLDHGYVIALPASRRDGKLHRVSVKVATSDYELWMSPRTVTCGGASPTPAPSSTPCPPCPCASPTVTPEPTTTPTPQPTPTATPGPTDPPPANTSKTTIRWTQPEDSTATDYRAIDGYVTLYGTQPNNYKFAAASDAPEVTVNLTAGRWFFRTFGFNKAGAMSAPSEELIYTAP